VDIVTGLLGHPVAHLAEALCYKPEGRRFDSRWCRLGFSLTLSFRPHYDPQAVTEMSIRNIFWG